MDTPLCGRVFRARRGAGRAVPLPQPSCGNGPSVNSRRDPDLCGDAAWGWVLMGFRQFHRREVRSLSCPFPWKQFAPGAMPRLWASGRLSLSLCLRHSPRLAGGQGAGRARSQPGGAVPAPTASCSRPPTTLTQRQLPAGMAVVARGPAPREHPSRAARDPPCTGPPAHLGQQLRALRCLAGALAMVGPGGEAALEEPRARALLHGCFRGETHPLPTFGSASHLVLTLRQDTAQAQQTSWSSRADFKQKRCLRNLQSHICSEQKHPPARNTAFQILPLISGSSNNLLPIQLLVLQLTSQY